MQIPLEGLVHRSGSVEPIYVRGSHSQFLSDEEYELACTIRNAISKETPLARLLQYAIDVASDQFIEEEFYQRHENLLHFLAECGTDNDEILFLSYVKKHPDIFHCRGKDCDGRIVGGCPKMYCETCGMKYYLHIDRISDRMCERCVASKLSECPPHTRKRRYVIYAVN